MSGASWGAGVFDKLYAKSADPWDFEGSDYERAKYDATLEVLGDRRFADVLEVGCSIGVLTARLAARADRVLAVDVAKVALERAAERCREMPQVTFRLASVPREFPEGSFDLILFSEVLYFLSADDVSETARLAQAALRPGGLIVLVNWTGETNTPTTGDEAALLFGASAPGLRVLERRREATYRLDLLAG